MISFTHMYVKPLLKTWPSSLTTTRMNSSTPLLITIPTRSPASLDLSRKTRQQVRYLDEHGVLAQTYTGNRVTSRKHFAKALSGHEVALAEVLESERANLVSQAVANAGVKRGLSVVPSLQYVTA